jgi:hypothetical protein
MKCPHEGVNHHMDCHHCDGCQELVSSVRHIHPDDQFPQEHSEALWQCLLCSKTEMVMNGIREPHPELDYPFE